MAVEKAPSKNTGEKLQNPDNSNYNQWQKMAEEAPPFNSGETQSDNKPETAKNIVESDDWYMNGRVEQRNIDKIDISTDPR